MKNIKKEAAGILVDWYTKTGYGDDHINCTNHNELKLVLGNPQFDDKDLIKEINKQGKQFIRDNDIKLLDLVSVELKNDRELIVDFVKINGGNLEFAKEKFCDDKEIAIKAVMSTPESFCYVSERLKDDNDIVNHIILAAPNQLSLTTDRFKKNKDIAIGLLQRNSRLITVIDTELKRDKDILLECWKSIKEEAIYGGFHLKKSIEILIDNIAEDIKPFFKQVNVEEDNPNLIKEMDVSFNHLILSKELNTSSNRQNKKIKL